MTLTGDGIPDLLSGPAIPSGKRRRQLFDNRLGGVKSSAGVAINASYSLCRCCSHFNSELA